MDSVTDMTPSPTPEPLPPSDVAFTLGADAPGSDHPLASKPPNGIFGFGVVLAILLFLVGSVVYDRRNKP